MTINIFHIALVSLFFIASSFFGLVAFPLNIIDALALISIIIIIFYNKEFLKHTLYEDKHFYIFFMYAFFMSIIMAYLNFGQPLFYSISAARMFIIYGLLIVALNIMLKNFDIKRAHIFMLIISFIIIFINLYVYTTEDISILVENVGILRRLGEIRITIGTFTAIIFIFYFYYALNKYKWMIIPLLGLLLVMIVVFKTRSVLFPVLIILLLPLLRAHKSQILKTWMIFTLIIVISFIATGYEKSILSPIVKLFTLLMEESQSAKNLSSNIRGIELVYYWNFLDIKSIIFGYGMDNKQFKELYDANFFLTDIGLFNIFYYHGILGSFLYIGMLWRLYSVSKIDNSALHMTGRSIVYFQILSPNSVFMYSPGYMLLLFIVYILVKNDNKNKLPRNYHI